MDAGRLLFAPKDELMANRNAASQQLARKRLVKKRGEQCEWCGETRYIELHHIVEVQHGGTFEEGNLLLLCMLCHMKAHGHKPKRALNYYA